MRELPVSMANIIASGDFTADQKALCRVVIFEDPFLGIYPIPDFAIDRNGNKRVRNTFSSLPFRQVELYGRELPNVKKVDWSRSTEGEIGSCTMELYNTRPLPPGTGPDKGDSFDMLGYYTYNRGRTTYSQSVWGHDANEWQGVLTPDSMVCVYQGYGVADYDVHPENDPALVRTGVWLVDDVTYTADGLITVQMRDPARLLSDQISFPPVVPLELYPQKWEQFEDFQPPSVTETNTETALTGRIPGVFNDSSVTPYRYAYPNDVVFGHHPSDAFDGNYETFWLSVGNAAPNGSYSKEWIETKVPEDTKTNFTLVSVKGGPYTVYVSIFDNATGKWRGNTKIPYTPPNNTQINNGSSIPYSYGPLTLDADSTTGFVLSGKPGYEPIQGGGKIRYTFTDLKNFGVGDPYKYRVGVREIIISGSVTTTEVITKTPPLQLLGNYGDYSDIVKMLLAWGGFYLQDGAAYYGSGNRESEGIPNVKQVYGVPTADQTLLAFDRETRLNWYVRLITDQGGFDYDTLRARLDHRKYGNRTQHFTPLPSDPEVEKNYYPPLATLSEVRARVIELHEERGVEVETGVKGRIWGDIEQSGVAGKVPLGVEIWDKKPLLDGITYIKDILGFIFFIDEQGAAQWRSPNTFRKGNWLTNVDGTNLRRTPTFITIRDFQTILGLRAVLSSRNIRDNIFVANVNGKIGAVSEGRVPSGGFRRVGGWTDQNFATEEECQVMADLITLRQMFTYRQSSLRIPANPSIQVDDQVEIQERTTGEAYLHYVKAINSSWDLEKGVWTYDLTTSWLGEDPAGEWAFKTTGLAQATIDYLTGLGQI